MLTAQSGVGGEALQQHGVQAGTHLQMGVAQADLHQAGNAPHRAHRQVPGLKQQCLRRDVFHVESGQQRLRGDDAAQIRGELLALVQQFDQKAGHAGLKPVGAEFENAKHQLV